MPSRTSARRPEISLSELQKLKWELVTKTGVGAEVASWPACQIHPMKDVIVTLVGIRGGHDGYSCF